MVELRSRRFVGLGKFATLEHGYQVGAESPGRQGLLGNVSDNALLIKLGSPSESWVRACPYLIE